MAADARSRRDENAADLNTAKQELVLLQQGLKRYDYLITNGETRIRTLSPAAASGKKRRREHLGPRLYVSKLDLDNDAFTVANAGDDDASLAGYKVRCAPACWAPSRPHGQEEQGRGHASPWCTLTPPGTPPPPPPSPCATCAGEVGTR